MNKVLFRPNKGTVIYVGKKWRAQADTGNIFFSISTGNGQFQSTKIALKCKNF